MFPNKGISSGGRLSKPWTPNCDAATSYQETQSDPNVLDQIRDMIDENNEEDHNYEIPPNDTLEAEADNDWSYRSMLDGDFDE